MPAPSWTGRSLLTTLLLLCAASVARAQDEPWFFVQLSDPQMGMFAADSNFVQETANLEFAVATLNRIRPAFVVVTGDLVNKPGDAAQIAEYRRIMARLDPSIPVYNVAGNHDVENAPTPESIEAYRRQHGPDRYVIRHRDLVGIVLNSSVIHTPTKASAEYEAQRRWMAEELERASRDGARHLVIFQHHPWFLTDPAEKDEYFNIPMERRTPHLDLFRRHGVSHLFSGHYHRNSFGKDGEMEMVTSGPIGMPLGKDGSGLRIVIVRENAIDHRYYEMGEIPNRIDLAKRVEPEN
jgi:serine/threonine-protein phosphatase CPPED1